MNTIGPKRDHGYHPGQIVPVSGIYTVVHVGHRADHQVIAIRGEEFPACRACNHRVTFYPLEHVPHVTHDFDLAGPAPFRVKARMKAAKKGAA